MHTTSRNSLHTIPTKHNIYRQYYTENDFILSPEGILKVLSVVVCIIWAVAQLSSVGVSCSAALAGGVASITCACTCALHYAAVVLRAPLCAPQLCLYMDIILSSVMGVLLLIISVLIMALCSMNTTSDYILGGVGVVSGAAVIASAVFTYVSIMRLWDEVHTPHETTQPPPHEQDV